MKRTQVLRSIGYTYSAPPTPTNAANMKAREHEYAPVRDRAPLITSLAHRVAHYLAQIEPYARMMPLLMYRFLRLRENESCYCQRCSFSQSVLPRVGSLVGSCKWHAKHGHAYGRATTDVYEMGHRGCKRVPVVAAAVARADLFAPRLGVDLTDICPERGQARRGHKQGQGGRHSKV